MLKNKFKILSCIFIIAILISSVCFATDDTTLITEDTSSLEPEWVKSDLFLCEDDIVIEGVVDGNVFAIGKTVTVKAEIGGDLFVIADAFNLDGGYIYSSIFGITGDMNINGIAYDIYAIAENFTLEKEGYIFRDLKLTAANVNLNGLVRRDAYIASQDINFAEESNTYIQGNLNYSSNTEISVPEGAVAGEISYNSSNGTSNESNSVMSYIIDTIISLGLLLLNTFVIVILAMWITPNFIKKVSTMGIKKTLIALPIGLAALIAIPVISILALFTIIAIPLSCALLSMYFLLIAFSTAFASIAIGSIIIKKFKLEGKVKFVLITLASTVVIFVLGLIPFVGDLISFLSLILGLGTVVFNLFRKVPTEVKE